MCTWCEHWFCGTVRTGLHRQAVTSCDLTYLDRIVDRIVDAMAITHGQVPKAVKQPRCHRRLQGRPAHSTWLLVDSTHYAPAFHMSEPWLWALVSLPFWTQIVSPLLGRPIMIDPQGPDAYSAHLIKRDLHIMHILYAYIIYLHVCR